MKWDYKNNRLGIDCPKYGALILDSDFRKCDCSGVQVGKSYSVAWDELNNRCGIDCKKYGATIISAT